MSNPTITCFSTARETLAALREKTISAREVLELHREQVERVNPAVNALVSVDFDRAGEAALAADDALARGADVGRLHGLPFAFKDTHEVKGWRTTHGSPLMAEHIGAQDELLVERILAAGALTMAKTNVPEWAAGSHTFNPVFGTTRNPYDLSRSAGGSSGGAAAALASGMVMLADGSDMGGSLRNPASFCNVVGFRPTPGRVPIWPTPMPLQTIAVAGPMARTVDDLALLLSVMAGPTSRTPLVLGDPGTSFRQPPPVPLAGLRVAYSEDLGGAFPVDPDVRAVLRAQRSLLAGAGAVVEDAHPDLTGAEESFRVLRANMFDGGLGALLDAHPDQFKASLARNIRDGRALSGHDVAAAMATQAALYDRAHAFFDRYDVLLLPVSQVAPFNADLEYPAAVDGEPTHFYLDWMRSVYFISSTGCPAISMPAGFTADGLPVGVQLVARQQDDARLLGIAAAFERLNPAGDRRPALAEPAAAGRREARP
ncbi:amidase [Specibacter cremeus]|uniref:amidase n=1 Tax=Specibacter cremeus TaxID=1629051 RepID=UPI000F7829AA|nr:amidase [Specibacter cremeus]